MRWRSLFWPRRALFSPPDKSRRPPQQHNPLLHRFGLHLLAPAPRKRLRAGRVIVRLASFG